MPTPSKNETEHLAKARITDSAISTKHSVEIARSLRYKTTGYAKQFLAQVIAMHTPVAFRRFKHNIGHKPGMAAGRFPQKAAKEFLRLVASVEANAQVKGLDTASLKIVKILANKASTPSTGGRHRQGTKRTHLEIQVKERKKAAPKEASRADTKGKTQVKKP